ncbi:unnamed protein product [Durusdinium trenchii]|uniref:Uncharacterized protein n=1 Tax=Durusdinium trenchii TaxID=1381693 RepID=A0ABP0NZ31_9DINO
MLDARGRSHEASSDAQVARCAVCPIPIAMKCAAFLVTTISAAVRLQLTSEESSPPLSWSPHPDDPVPLSFMEDFQHIEVPWSLADDVNGSTIQEELVKFLDKAQLGRKKKKSLLSKMRGLFRSKKEVFPKIKEPDRRAVTFLESAMKGDAKEPCQQQLGGLMKELQKACEQAWQGEEDLRRRQTCTDSVKDLFLNGQDLVETSQIPHRLMWMNGVPPETLPLVKSLEFLQKWLVKLATAKKEAILWAGFWTDPDAEDGHLHRASKETLQRFAHLTETETVHPSTKLGRMIEEFNELDQCKGELAWKLTGNFWSFASYSFVLGMKRKKQGTVIALVNKDLEGPRSLSKSVLFQHEVPTLGIAAWGLGFWSPQVILIDLKATCNKTSSMLRERLFARLSSYFRVKAQEQYFTSAEYALRSKPSWQCLDCEEGKCELGPELALHLQVLRQVQRRKDRFNQQLLEAVQWHKPVASVERLLRLNADPAAAYDADGVTPLHLATRGCQVDNARALLHHGAPTEAKTTDDENVPLMELASCHNADGPVIAQQLLLGGANASARDWEGRTALDVALQSNRAVAEVLKKAVAVAEVPRRSKSEVFGQK